ncbi:HGxxPAAW family protein [Luteimicrobium subarcticum]|uniref:Uncharacterized protein n=1 Tax=Luteimicrobium subarcticum TaxID=620910 RepID=A0A2M8W3G2_9MICO|nr:HGxxPAAW family protein [Luteimicrobium subarcticum]PJI85472.1 hypothetical protein CLV34_2985 [Luteimicrobium subarcticum]
MSDNYLPPASPRANEGHTLAAWFAMIGVMVGVLLVGIGMVVVTPVVWVAGVVVVLVGLVGGWFLRKAGHGQPAED